ncbi:hypothetical protein H6P81_010566 [Aristolochia fimbriata]|uniref:Uncharacterized protein n=1 Tax=Aristolochia fimbriata TaxID=158543 RepID=A0AAV7ESI9_ARIFI|nr:hypothetical protein H6P81_010566 [Aristolochia fimbriata]
MANSREQKSNHELQQQLQDLKSLFVTLNPSYTLRNIALQSHSSQLLQRGPSYEAYSSLRDFKLRQRKAAAAAAAAATAKAASPLKKKVSFLAARPIPKEPSLVAQSVPDFSNLLRKENKKPNTMTELTPPPPARGSKGAWRGGGVSKSASGGEKRGVDAARKSCVNLRELKGLSAAAASAIDEAARGRSKAVAKKTVAGSRLY